MSFHRIHKSTAKNTQTSQTTSQFASRPFSIEKTQRPPTQEEIENQAFEQNKFEASGLQLKETFGTITPVEQERLGALQAKMDSFWVQRMQKAKAQPNLLEILVQNPQATAPVAPIQPQQAIGQSNNELIQTKKAKKTKKVKTAKEANKQENQESQGTVKLRTALDSKVTVAKGEGDRYNIMLNLDAADERLVVASYKILGCGLSWKYLPVYVEDVVTDSVALVRIQFNPNLASVKVLVGDEMHGNQRVRVEAIPTPADELQVASAPKAREAGSGYVAEGQEKVTEHSGGSELDKVLGSVASAEGGFASTEGSDKGIFTWGQGQWTVGANLLQPVMQFIKDQRPDLFDHYWGATGLDVRGSVFYYQGKPYVGKKKLRELFRSSKEQNLLWVNVFAQAGQDPQIQRLQREYQRGEVRDQLEKQIGSKSPDTWLDTRGKAFYYSMWVNLPGVAHTYFKQACQKAGKATAPTDAIKQAISTELEDLFNNSGVTARSDDDRHYIAFWGEAGRNKAIAEADKHIADPSLDKTWTTQQWQKHKTNMEKRESRYKKTKADINKALSRQDVEPDVPDALGSYFQ